MTAPSLFLVVRRYNEMHRNVYDVAESAAKTHLSITPDCTKMLSC